jgi:hypothetical protein
MQVRLYTHASDISHIYLTEYGDFVHLERRYIRQLISLVSTTYSNSCLSIFNIFALSLLAALIALGVTQQPVPCIVLHAISIIFLLRTLIDLDIYEQHPQPEIVRDPTNARREERYPECAISG